ncbi:MAG: MGMT family protein [Propionibacteriaceae bacterium]|jgi:methylated-DNA-protein-cysteine methyltransferase-like protein|nr:MGMT family protein [Propionibacteriaceae bacterium]
MVDQGVPSLRDRVWEMVADIPPGRVMTYGDIAAACGYPGAARGVGNIARLGGRGLPWHRVVRAGGRLADVGDERWQADALAAEGVTVRAGRILNFSAVAWYPD